jgi:hypothetical protein
MLTFDIIKKAVFLWHRKHESRAKIVEKHRLVFVQTILTIRFRQIVVIAIT